MEDLVEVISYINNVLYVALAVAAFRSWRRQGGAASAWVAATFATLAAIGIVGLIQPEDAEGAGADLVQKATILGVVFFPYGLYRFTSAIRRTSPLIDRVALAATVAIAIWTVFLGDIPEQGEERGLSFQLYLIGLLAQWGGLLITVAVRLWGAGKGQPTLARRRMRVLSLGSIGMTLALVIAGSAAGSEGDGAVQLITGLLATASVTFFFLGFAPPALLRIAWRRPEQEALRGATEQLVAASTAEEVTQTLLPHVTRTLGAQAAILVDKQGRTLGSHGNLPAAEESVAPVRTLTEETVHPDLLRLDFDFGSVIIWASPYTPFFGQEEVELLRTLGVLTGLALDRTELYRREQDARAAAESANLKLQEANAGLIESRARLAEALASEQEARRSLEELNREMESFVYTVSHDLNSPIIAIQGFSDFLSKDFGEALPEKGRFYIERISVSAAYLQLLIRDLLQFSRVGRTQTEPEDVSLQDIVQQAADEVAASVEDLKVSATDLPEVRMNPLRARQLFTNLMQNSSRYAGRPDVRMTIMAAPGDQGYVVISARDNGPGIPEQFRNKVFGVFERLQQTGKIEGSGMGLPICKRIVETSGGTMWIADCDEGLDIRFTLPLAADDAQPPGFGRATS